ncbi:MAG TPA: chromate transporter [Candidatus Avibacteroides excrementipullorum]|jgi:chromate transporter|nr:chromate transporter [Candidatus Avibacteroides excrementipullorum]
MSLKLFFIFMKIGLFTIGGGYAMVPLIEEELVRKRKWLGEKEFIDVLAVSQSIPGILAVNMAIFVGQKIVGFKGSVMSALGTVLPSFIIILAIAFAFSEFQDNEVVQRVFKGIRPAVVALIAAPCFKMSKSAGLNKKNIFIPLVAVILICVLYVSPIYVIIAAGLGGFVYGRLRKEEVK